MQQWATICSHPLPSAPEAAGGKLALRLFGVQILAEGLGRLTNLRSTVVQHYGSAPGTSVVERCEMGDASMVSTQQAGQTQQQQSSWLGR